jgi:hypothetical protein
MEKLLKKKSIYFDFNNNDIDNEYINMDYMVNNYPILKKYVIILLDNIIKIPTNISVFKEQVFDSVEDAEIVISENQLSSKFKCLIYPILVIKDHEKLSDVIECLSMDNYIRDVIENIKKQRRKNVAKIIPIEEVYEFNKNRKLKR